MLEPRQRQDVSPDPDDPDDPDGSDDLDGQRALQDSATGVSSGADAAAAPVAQAAAQADSAYDGDLLGFSDEDDEFSATAPGPWWQRRWLAIVAAVVLVAIIASVWPALTISPTVTSISATVPLVANERL